MLHQLQRQQFIPSPIEAVWDYFSTPRNLNELTPPELKFRILSEVPDTMYAGQLIEYRVSPLPGVWFPWLTEIRHVQPGHYFVDEQRRGPYRFWYHEHIFDSHDGGVQMTDRVTYEVGLGWCGELAHKIWVQRQLRRIFDFRAQRVREIFEGVTTAEERRISPRD